MAVAKNQFSALLLFMRRWIKLKARNCIAEATTQVKKASLIANADLQPE